VALVKNFIAYMIIFFEVKDMVLEAAVQKEIDIANDEAAIRARFQQMVDGWNHGYDEIFASSIDDEADCVSSDGTHTKGRKESVSSRETLFGRRIKDAIFVGTVKSVRFLAPSVALVHASGGIINSGGRKLFVEQKSIQTLVAVKRSGKWYFTAFHGARIKPIRRKMKAKFVRYVSSLFMKLPE
jgi:uncharacterized protein (TIGR02246 family)